MTMNLARCVFLALVVLGATSHLSAQSRPALVQVDAGSHAAAIERGRFVMDQLLARIGGPGMAVAVAVDGEVVWSEGFGWADLEAGVPATAETRFRVGSVSKPITAAAIGVLLERGALDLDAPVQQYVPSFPTKRWPITTRQVAGHIAGIRHYNGDEFLSSTRYATVLEGLTIFQGDTLLFQPGTRYSYSSHGWNLVSAAIEGASGEPFLSFMQTQVFGPLGLTSVVADHTDSIVPQRTRFYERTREGGIINAPYVDNSYKWAGGGFLSTAEDLARFGMAHLDPGFLKPETVEMLWASQHLTDGRATDYGIGWGSGTDHEGRRVVHHGGSSVGGRAFLVLFPAERVVVALLSNASAPMTFSTAWTIAEPFLPPTIADRSYVDHSGTYACTYPGEGGPQTGTVRVLGTPERYLVEVRSDQINAEGILAWGEGRKLRAITLEDGFWVTNLWLTMAGSSATGHYGSVPLTCEAQ